MKQFYLMLIMFVAVLTAQSAFAVPEIQTWQTKGGAKVLFVETAALPMVDIRVIFSAGAARDENLPGLAMLSNALLSSGAGPWSADQIAEKLDSVGAVMSNESARDMAIVSLRSLTAEDKLNTSLAVFSEVIANPRFNSADIERDRKRVLAALQHKQQSPGSVASDAFYQLIFGQHPYGSPPDGTAKSIAKISRKDIKAFHKQFYVARNAVVAVVGGVSLAQAKDLVEQVLSGLKAGEAAPELPPVVDLGKSEQKSISMPTTQTNILLGQPGIARGDEDYFALYVGNHVLGGGGSESVLMNEIREKRGLAYDTRSYFRPMLARGPFIASVETRNEQAAEALSLLLENIKRFRNEGPTQEELDLAINNITGGFPMNIDSNSDIVGYLGAIGFYKMPLNHLQTFSSKVKAVTVQQVRDAFQRRLDPNKFVIVKVGNPAK